ncbi:MAG: metal ABC transporter ATP-binding protein [Candidatus Omnitrophica bacterium]|nr:metal ABC transporter ATP-binding protein [Candidatus Omnitrophota bacterium]
MPEPLIRIRDLRVEYRGTPVLTVNRLEVEAGEYLGIVGPNGSGKTTFVKALLGLVGSSGEVLFDGKPFAEFLKTAHVGYLPQKMSFLDPRFPATAREIVLSGVYCCKRFPKRLTAADHKAADEVMVLLGITELAGRLVGRLSGGQQQRVLLARALVHPPKVLILDEPSSALDTPSRRILYDAVRALHAAKRIAVMVVSHDVVTIGKDVSKLLYLDREVVFHGTSEEFQKSPSMVEYLRSGQPLICHRR